MVDRVRPEVDNPEDKWKASAVAAMRCDAWRQAQTHVRMDTQAQRQPHPLSLSLVAVIMMMMVTHPPPRHKGRP